MGCACSKNKNKEVLKTSTTGSSQDSKNTDSPLIKYSLVDGKVVTSYIAPNVQIVEENSADSIKENKKMTATKTANAVSDAKEIGLTGCYLCAKKHLGRAQIFFEEYKMGYPERIKSLVDTFFDMESDVYKAFTLWQKVQNQMDMASGELIGSDFDGKELPEAHVKLAEEIRGERLKLEENPLYKPRFDILRAKVHLLQKQVERVLEDKETEQSEELSK